MDNDIKMAFFDLDGTLINNNNQISKEDLKAIKELKKRGIKIVLASGRFDKYVLKWANIIEEYDYLITNNGSLIYNSKKEIIYEKLFDDDLLEKLWNYATKTKTGLTLNTRELRYSNIYSTTNSEANKIITNISEIKTPIYQLVFSSLNHDVITSLIDNLKKYPIHILYISNHYYTKEKDKSISVDVNLKNVSKGQAIIYLQQQLNIQKENCICFGDNLNDKTMFDKCGIKVVMDNANPQLKTIASYITLDNNHSGVAYFINKYLIKKEN